MQHLFAIWDTIIAKTRNNLFCIFLDFDGTLVKIVPRPNQIIIAQKIIDILRLLSLNPRCQLVVISGRALADIRKLLGIPNILYVGNHGFEFGDVNCSYEFPVSRAFKEFLARLKTCLEQRLSAISGIILEDKKYSLSIHYRLVSDQDIILVNNIIDKTLGQLCLHGEVKVIRGKKVIEIIPPMLWHKGTMALLITVLFKLIVGDRKVTPFYFGDDATDENAFRSLKEIGFNVFVGKPTKTQARYYLNCPREVYQTLVKLNHLLAAYGDI